MPGRNNPEWPDKAMFASIMLVLAGALGTMFSAALPFISFGDSCNAGTSAAPSDLDVCNYTWVPAFMQAYPWWLALALSLACLGLGVATLRTHRRVYGFLGAACAVASLSFVGFVPLLGLIAVGFLAQASREGEDLTGGRPLDSSAWPDKALASSLFLLVSGLLALGWGVLILSDASNPVLLPDLPWLEGAFDIAAALFCGVAAWQVYHLQRAWTGFVAIALAALTFGMYVVAPVLAGVALVLLLLARRENEFEAAGA